jgi:hypothetical protein
MVTGIGNLLPIAPPVKAARQSSHDFRSSSLAAFLAEGNIDSPQPRRPGDRVFAWAQPIVGPLLGVHHLLYCGCDNRPMIAPSSPALCGDMQHEVRDEADEIEIWRSGGSFTVDDRCYRAVRFARDEGVEMGRRR